MLKDVLQELSETAKGFGITNAAETIVLNIKSTMSDRASSQKSFNALLASYRADILPTVVTNWNSLSANEQSTLSQMHNFYCAMHLIVNMAENASEALKLIEQNYDSPVTHSVHSTTEPSSIRLIRTACKAFERRGDEKSGCPLQFMAYLKRKNISKNPLIHFRGNRFNVIFANGARIYYLHKHIADFLKSWGTPNRLLQAVLEDINNDINIAGSKALGLIDKLITGPLWRVLESGVHVMDIPQHYANLKEFVDKQTESTIGSFMTGEDVPFSRDLVKKDYLWEALVSSSSYDNIAGHMLLSIFKAFGLLLDRVLADLLPVMQAEEDNKQKMHAETSSVPCTNTISERDFAKFDRLLREKPHASTLALEAHILLTNNKTIKWLDQKSTAEKEKLMEEARKNAPHYHKIYKERLSQIEKEQIKQQEEKIMKIQEAERRSLEAKEKIVSEIISYGLWQSIEQMNSCLNGIGSETQKRVAIKAQLRFRKVVLQQEAPETLFKFSSKEKGQYTSQILRDNLALLLQQAQQIETITSSLTGKSIKHQFEVDKSFSKGE